MAKGNIDLAVGRKKRKRKIRREVRTGSGNSDETIQTREEAESTKLAKRD
jgi:hypothetical protein